MSVLGNVSNAAKRGFLSRAKDLAARTTQSAISGGAAAYGLSKMASHHWVATSAIVGAAIAVGGYTSQSRQSIPAGPTTMGTRIGQGNSASNYNLGATGDLVFALNRLR